MAPRAPRVRVPTKAELEALAALEAEAAAGVDDEDDGDEDAEDELAGFFKQIGSDGARISCRVVRALRPEDEGVVSAGYMGSLPKAGKTLSPDSLEDELRALAGGGSWGGAFDLEFKVDGKYQKGGRRRFNLAGPAKPDKAPDSPAATVAPKEDPRVASLESRLAAFEADAAARAEQDKLSRALAPVLAQLAELKAERAAPRDTITETLLQRAINPPAPAIDPQVAALVKTVESLQSSLAKQNDDAQKARIETLTAELASIRATLVAASEVKPTRPKDAAAEMFAPIAEAIAVSTLMRSAGEIAEENEDTGLADLLNEFKGPIFTGLRKLAKSAMKSAAPMLEAAAAASASAEKPPETPGTPPEPVIVPPTFQSWAVYLLTGNDAMARVQDVEWVRASLAAYRSNVEACAKITTTPGLLEFVRATLGEAAEGEVKAGLAKDPKNEAAALTLVAVLKQTIARADAAPAPNPVQAVVEPPTNTEEDDA